MTLVFNEEKFEIAKYWLEIWKMSKKNVKNKKRQMSREIRCYQKFLSSTQDVKMELKNFEKVYKIYQKYEKDYSQTYREIPNQKSYKKLEIIFKKTFAIHFMQTFQ